MLAGDMVLLQPRWLPIVQVGRVVVEAINGGDKVMVPVLLSLGQPAQLSKDVQEFLRVLIIGAPGYIAFESLKKYLQCQDKSLNGFGIVLTHSLRNNEGLEDGSNHCVPDQHRHQRCFDPSHTTWSSWISFGTFSNLLAFLWSSGVVYGILSYAH
jgi:hypothetical protein